MTNLLQQPEGPGILPGSYLTESVEPLPLDGKAGSAFTVDLRELARELGGRDEVNRLHERVSSTDQQDLQRMPPRWTVGIETFRSEWLRAGSQVPCGDSTAEEW